MPLSTLPDKVKILLGDPMSSNGAVHPSATSTGNIAASCDTTPLLSATHSNWRDLYTAAILEPEKSAIARRVLDAEEAILKRGRELFYNSATGEEQEELEDALYILRALRTACI